MKIILEHIVPIALMLGGAAICFVFEFLLKKGILLKGKKASGVLINLSVCVSLLIGTGMLVYLTCIGAGLEFMLPAILLILLGAMI